MKNILDKIYPSGALKTIEKRLLEIDEEREIREHNFHENFSGSSDDEIEFDEIKHLNTEQSQLELKRRFILDRREGWRQRIVWNLLVPITVAIIAAYFTVVFTR
jgi:hypothetical protein